MTRKALGPINPDWLADRKYKPSLSSNFPSDPEHGQLHFPAGHATDDPEWCYYDENYAKWLSMSRYTVIGKQFGSSSTLQGLHMDYASGTLWRYGGAVGVPNAYDWQLVSMRANVVVSSTCTFGVYRTGVAVTNGTIALAASTGASQDGYTTAATISAGGAIGIHQTAGTVVGGGVVSATFARVMT